MSQTDLMDLMFGKRLSAGKYISQTVMAMVRQTKLGGGGGGMRTGVAIQTELSEGTLGRNIGTDTSKNQVPGTCMGRVIREVGARSVQMLSRRLVR